ncbi:MAG TPA: hypothetical protein VJ063_10700, partial [Verrucomicrobiae bacterium]|nr:hypothetical protein [Verrucomicrobiae bacterium]
MGTENTPLIQKLILGVLTLILLCLIVLIAQNRPKPQPNLKSAAAIIEPVPAPAEAPPEKPAVVRTTPAPRSLPVSAVPQPDARVVTQSAVRAPTSEPHAIPPPLAQTTLVNPVARTPLDIVVRPGGEVLQTELCGRVRLEGKPPR